MITKNGSGEKTEDLKYITCINITSSCLHFFHSRLIQNIFHQLTFLLYVVVGFSRREPTHGCFDDKFAIRPLIVVEPDFSSHLTLWQMSCVDRKNSASYCLFSFHQTCVPHLDEVNALMTCTPPGHADLGGTRPTIKAYCHTY